MKVQTLLRAQNGFSGILTDKISPRLAYKILKFAKAIETENEFARMRMQEILNKYGEKDESGNLVANKDGVKIRDDARDICTRAINELENTDVEAPDITFTIDELSEVKLSVKDMIALEPFIKD